MRREMQWLAMHGSAPSRVFRLPREERKRHLIETGINDCFRRSMNGTALRSRWTNMRDIVRIRHFSRAELPVRVEMEVKVSPLAAL